MEDHCLSLLTYVSRNRNEPQSYRTLSDQCGLPEGTLKAIISFHRHHGDGGEIDPITRTVAPVKPCYLCRTAQKYHFSFRVMLKDNDRFIEAFIEAEELGYEDEPEHVQRGWATLPTNAPTKCPDCAGRVVTRDGWEYVCEGCGRCF